MKKLNEMHIKDAEFFQKFLSKLTRGNAEESESMYFHDKKREYITKSSDNRLFYLSILDTLMKDKYNGRFYRFGSDSILDADNKKLLKLFQDNYSYKNEDYNSLGINSHEIPFKNDKGFLLRSYDVVDLDIMVLRDLLDNLNGIGYVKPTNTKPEELFC